MEDKTITITKTPGQLSLNDNGHTFQGKSGNVIWHPGKGVGSIISVKEKSGSQNTTAQNTTEGIEMKTTVEFWSVPPAQNGVNFHGKISDNAVEGWAWDYDIVTDAGSIDPRIQVI